MSEIETERHDDGTVTVRFMGPQVNGFFVPVAVKTVKDSYELRVRVYTDGEYPSPDKYVEFVLGDIDQLAEAVAAIRSAL